MYSVNRTIGVATIFRSSAYIRAAAAEPAYSCDIKSGVISSGWEEHMTQAGRLFLDPITSGYDNPMLLIGQPRMVFSRETGTTLSQTSEPPSSETTIIGEPDLQVTRLDVPSTDSQATLEFRLSEVQLPPVTGASTTDYNRIYLVANSAVVDYKVKPATTSAAEPGILHQNVSGGGVFDPSTDLYVVTADGGSIVNDGTNDVWINRADLLTDPVWNQDVVLAAIDLRNTMVDDIDDDILRGSATAVTTVAFRIVM